MTRSLIYFHIVLFCTLFASYLIHDSMFVTSKLLSLYILNASIAIIVYWSAYLFRNKHKDYLAFYFLGGSTAKFLLFFLILLPFFKQDKNVSSQEFFSFFIPYLVTLIIETIALISLLNKVNNSKVKK